MMTTMQSPIPAGATALEAAETLEKAAALIEKKGWCQGQFRNSDDALCALGSIHEAVGTHPASGLVRSFDPHSREEEREMLPQCRDMGVGVIPWSPLARGRLARPPEQATTTRRGQQDGFSGILYDEAESAILEAVAAIAEHRGVSRAQVALAWLLANDAVTAPIVGATRLAHLDDAVAATGIELDEKETEQLEAPYRPRPVLGHG